jgi:hypothetical protein
MLAEAAWTVDDRIMKRECLSPTELRMTARSRPRLSLSLNGLSARQLAVETWRRMERHYSMIWAAAIAFYAMFASVPFLVVTVLRLPDLTGAGGRASGLGDLTVDQPVLFANSGVPASG